MKKLSYLILLLALVSYGAAPTRDNTYVSGTTIRAADVTANEDEIFGYLQTGVDTIRANGLDATNEISTSLCSDGQVLKKASGVWACAADAGGGTVAWDDIGAPDANDEIDFGAYVIELNVENFQVGDGGANFVDFDGTPTVTFNGNADINLPDDSVDTADIGTNQVGLDALNVSDVSDDIAGDIAEGELANSIVISADIKDDTIESADYAAGSIDAEHLAADIIDETKIADDGIDSEHYNNGSIDAVHLAADIIDETKIADDGINSEHYNDGSVDFVHLGTDLVTGAAAVGTFASGDTFICMEAGVGVRECDYDDLPSGSGATELSGLSDVGTSTSTTDNILAGRGDHWDSVDPTDLCEAITGSADLCDGTDDEGAGGSGATELDGLSDVSSSSATSGHILIGHGVDYQNQAVSGDITISADGVTAIGADVITHADIADADQADTKCLWIENPTAADDFASIWRNGTANSFLITEIWGESDQKVTFDLEDGAGDCSDAVELESDEDEKTGLSCTLSADEELDLDIVSVEDTPTWVSICFTGNWVD